MIIGEKLRVLREAKNFSQGDVEEKTGLLRCYISRVENGHTVPAIETLEKFARALEVPLYQLFIDINQGSGLPPTGKDAKDDLFGRSGKERRQLAKFCSLLAKMTEGNRTLLLNTAQEMGRR
jgi:transcriptional regulator with XRE-family HTH domain